MIDPERIFGLFSALQNNDGVGEALETYIDIKDTPEYKVGMFTRIIMDHLNFNHKVAEFFSKAHDDLEEEDITLAGEFVVYHRGWYYIKDIDLKDKRHWYAVEKMSNLKTLTAIDLSIHYFEEVEDYEKCAHLLKISKAIETFIS
jgi:hypothetical protein